jgi:dTDP-4-amino-4,6-dideoxygalactose transaminase
VHLHGLICEMVPLMEIAESRGLTVIEDAAQAHGAKYKGRRSGSIGHIGCFSFYPSKNLGAYGEGGAIVTNDDEYAEKVRKMRDWGQGEKYCHVMQGFNCRMDGIQGSVLNVKLKYIDEWNEARRRVAANYDALFSGHVIAVPKSIESSRHVYHVYALRLTDRNAVRERLTDNGVATGIHYPLPLHLQPIFSDLGHKAGDFPVAEQIASETLSLPIYPELVQENIEKIAKILIAAPVKNKGWNKVPQEHT